MHIHVWRRRWCLLATNEWCPRGTCCKQTLSHSDCTFHFDIASRIFFPRAHGVVVSHPLRMRKALGLNPSGSKTLVAGEVCQQDSAEKVIGYREPREVEPPHLGGECRLRSQAGDVDEAVDPHRAFKSGMHESLRELDPSQ